MAIDRPKEPPKFDDEDDFFGEAFPKEHPTTPAEAVPDERPTVSPPFDVEEYAKASDSKVRAARTPSLQRPSPDDIPNDASTKPPPAPSDFDISDELPHVLAGKAQAPRAPQITLTDDDELETARARSVYVSERPPPPRDPESSPEIEVVGGDEEEPQDEPADEAGPATVAYPPEYEKDPFARLGDSGAPPGGPDPLREMRDRFSLGDYTGALETAEALLRDDPTHLEADRCAEECRAKLLQMYTARIGPLDRVPVVMVPREQLRWLSIDHRAGFLLSHIDGVSSLEMILDVSGMPLLDALKILCELAQQRVISFR